MGPQSGRDLCTYAWVVSGVSLVLTLTLMASVCIMALSWVVKGAWFEWALTLCGTVWWLVASIVFIAYTVVVNKQSDVQQPWRNAVNALCWAAFLLFFIDWIGCQVRLAYEVCGCCGNTPEKRGARAQARKDKAAAKHLAAKHQHDVENPHERTGCCGGKKKHAPATSAYPVDPHFVQPHTAELHAAPHTFPPLTDPAVPAHGAYAQAPGYIPAPASPNAVTANITQPGTWGAPK